MPQFIDK